MHTDLISIGLGFLEGLALILSPCVLPILPLLLAVSLTGHRYRPLGITLGFIVCFSCFAFFSRALVQATHIDLNLIHQGTYVLLFLLGVVMISSRLSLLWEQGLSRLNLSALPAQNKGDGLLSGFVLGAMIALVWVPCAGPILAAVIVQTVMQKANFSSFLVLLAFSTGIGLPMMAIAVYGRAVLKKFSGVQRHLPRIRQGMGIVIILSVLAMLWRDYAPNQNQVIAGIDSAPGLESALPMPYPAPALQSISAWINSPPLQLKDLHGQVVLIDFWTYSCINCIRTIPHLNALYAKYHQKGIEIIGVHAPEFVFEKDLNRVRQAVRQRHMLYPIALDNYFGTWLAFNNHYWPAQYLIDPLGNVVYEHFGEGADDILENNICHLLKMQTPVTKLAPVHAAEKEISPETYLGYERAESSNRPHPYHQNQEAGYVFPAELSLNAWALQGSWRVLGDRIISTQAHDHFKMHFQGKHVYLVMGIENLKLIHLSVRFNGKPQPGLEVRDNSLYPVLNFEEVVDGYLDIEVSQPGLALYTVTFGG